MTAWNNIPIKIYLNLHFLNPKLLRNCFILIFSLFFFVSYITAISADNAGSHINIRNNIPWSVNAINVSTINDVIITTTKNSFNASFLIFINLSTFLNEINLII